MNLTAAKKVEIVRLAVENDRSYREAAREFNVTHPERNICLIIL